MPRAGCLLGTTERPEASLCQATAAVLAGCLEVMTVADGLASDSWEVRSQLVAGWWEQQEGHLGRRKKSTEVLDSQE